MRRRPSRPLYSALLTGLGAGLGLAPPAAAQEVAETPRYRSNRPYQSEVDAAAAAEEPSRLWISGGIDVRSQYFFRGYNFVPSGPSIQPFAAVHYTVFEDKRVRVTPHLGTWFNFTEVKGPADPVHWNEFDAIAGVAVEVGDFIVDLKYVYYTSPSDYFKRFEEVGIDVRYDDGRLWPQSSTIAALNPSVSFYQEVHDKSRDGFDDERNSFVGLGLEPELQPIDVGRWPVTFSFPLTVGGSWNGYYLNDRGGTDQVGYWEAGVKAAVDLPSRRNGPQCRIEAEVEYIRLMADSVENANGGDGDDVVLRVGLKFAL